MKLHELRERAAICAGLDSHVEVDPDELLSLLDDFDRMRKALADNLSAAAAVVNCGPLVTIVDQDLNVTRTAKLLASISARWGTEGDSE